MSLIRICAIALRYGAANARRKRGAGGDGRFARPRRGALAAAAGLALALAAPAAPAEPLKIVALGDSLTHGYGLPPEEGFVPQLDAWLAERGEPEIEVVNAGVSGDTTAGGLARFEWSVAGGADALIVALGGNDLLRGLPPEESRANLRAILEKAEAQDMPVLISGMRAPLNYGPDFKEAFDSMYPELAEEFGALHDPFFLAGVEDDRALWQSDGLHPNAAGVARIVERIGPLVLELAEAARAP
jgi:acyl-CoA thioesterase-1